jgi:hypothetical protein
VLSENIQYNLCHSSQQEKRCFLSMVCPAKPDNISMSHPYTRFESDPLWPLLEQAIADLAANRDLQETTDRAYIVGYLCQVLRETPVVWADDDHLSKRRIKSNV